MSDTEKASSARDPLAVLKTRAGAFAMVAVDQREALRAMLQDHRAGKVSDADLTRFKVTATQVLSPYASAILVDREFGLDEVIRQHAVAPSCGLIASGDVFYPAHGELVGEVEVDHSGDLAQLKANGVVALKLLVLYRPDTPGADRIAKVRDFVSLCAAAGLISIIEPVSRKPLGSRAWDATDGMLAAADELGSLGADLYKTEVPFHGEAGDEEIRAACRTLTRTVSSPWVILSSGVSPDVFPHALALACQEGASGFLAGRAVWAPSLQAEDIDCDLRTNAVARLDRLARIAEREVRAAAPQPASGNSSPTLKAAHHA